MKRFIVIVNCIFLLASSLLYCMEKDLVLFLDKNPRKHEQIYFNETLPTLKLSTIGTHYCSLPKDSRNTIISRMSDELLMLHRIALWLPYDTQKQIFSIMLEDDPEVIDIFCNKKTVLKAFQLYHTISRSIKSHESVARLYKMPREKRDLVLGKLNRWDFSYARPILGEQDLFEIDILDADSRQYFLGTKAILLSDDEADMVKCKKCGVIMVGGCCTWVTIAGGILSVIGGVGGFQLVYKQATLEISFGVASAVKPVLVLFGIFYGIPRLCNHIKNITL